MTTHARYQTAADVFGDWKEQLLTGTPPTLFPCGSGDLARIELGPGLVTLVGGPPGAGKTAFTMQLVIDGLRLNPELRTLVCNVEVSPAVLLDRQLARLSGIDASRIRKRELGESHGERLDAGLHALESVADRLAFVRPPYDLGNVAAAADAHGAQIVVIDYLQRVRTRGNHGDRRAAVDELMAYMRQFADAGVAVLVVAAVGRQKDSKGRTSYAAEALSLASFRESSELEFGADDAFILANADAEGEVLLKHLKARHAEPQDMRLLFDKARQQFTPIEDEPATRDSFGLQAALEQLWNGGDDDFDDEGDE
jgi:replicative DNA helicase